METFKILCGIYDPEVSQGIFFLQMKKLVDILRKYLKGGLG